MIPRMSGLRRTKWNPSNAARQPGGASGAAAPRRAPRPKTAPIITTKAQASSA